MIFRATFSHPIKTLEDGTEVYVLERKYSSNEYKFGWATYGRSKVEAGMSRDRFTASKCARQAASRLGVGSNEIEIVSISISET